MLRSLTFATLLLTLVACGPSRADMQVLQTRLDETSGRLTATQEQLTNLQANSGQAEQQVSDLQQQVNQLSQENAALQAALDEARNQQSTVSNDGGSAEVEELRRELANRPSQAEVDLLAAQLRLLEENIASLESSE
jgi:predicted  nucleic acid-binding Zn-ribbon protein